MRQNSRKRELSFLVLDLLNSFLAIVICSYVSLGMIFHEERTLHYFINLCEAIFINCGFGYAISMKSHMRFRLIDFIRDHDLEINHYDIRDQFGNPTPYTQLVITDAVWGEGRNCAVLFCDHRAGAITHIQYKSDITDKIRETRYSRMPSRYYEIDGIFPDKPCIIDEFCLGELIRNCVDLEHEGTTSNVLSRYCSGRARSVHWGLKDAIPYRHSLYTVEEFEAL